MGGLGRAPPLPGLQSGPRLTQATPADAQSSPAGTSEARPGEAFLGPLIEQPLMRPGVWPRPSKWTDQSSAGRALISQMGTLELGGKGLPLQHSSSQTFTPRPSGQGLTDWLSVPCLHNACASTPPTWAEGPTRCAVPLSMSSMGGPRSGPVGGAPCHRRRSRSAGQQSGKGLRTCSRPLTLCANSHAFQ